MSTITIGKKHYDVSEQELNQSELLFYEENPRVYSILRKAGDTPTQKDIEEQLKSMDHVKQLRISIEQNGGLIDPIIVIKKDEFYVVLEGNSRLAAYRILAQKDPVKWAKIRCNILPEDITEKEIFTLLGQYHLIGRKDWSKFEQAAYLHRQKEATNLENDILAKAVGLTKSNVDAFLRVYEFMIKHDDLHPERWSYYDEYLKNRGISNYRKTSPKIDEAFVKMVDKGELKQAIDVRNVLGGLAKQSDKVSKKLMNEVIDGKENVYNAFERLKETGKTDNNYQKIKKFRETIQKAEFVNAIKHESVGNPNINFELKKIKKAVDDLLKDMTNNTK